MAWIMIKAADDIQNPPEDAISAAPGSTARTGDYAHIYNKQNDGTWKDIMDH